MTIEIELNRLDCRYESYRIKNPRLEGKLLSSVAGGIDFPLQGVTAPGDQNLYILLDGFKRYRCARKLKLTTVPFSCLGEDAAGGIIELLRPCEQTGLTLLEQARFVDELANVHQMSIAEIAAELGKSKSWVAMRLGIIDQMSAKVGKEIFAGRFSAYCYMYTLRQFRRMNGVSPEQIEQFVTAVSGRNLSVREIEQLAHGFFRGPDSFRREILEGNLALSLEHIEQLRQALHHPAPHSCEEEICSEFERVVLRDLERAGKYMQRVMGKCEDPKLASRAFYAQAHLLTTGLLNRTPAFTQSIEKLHDRSRQA